MTWGRKVKDNPGQSLLQEEKRGKWPSKYYNQKLPARNGFIEKHNLPVLVELSGANWPIFENWLAYCLFPMCLLFRSIWFLHFESPALTSREFFGAETPTSFENNSNEICNKLFTDSYHPPLFSQLIMWKLWFHCWGLPVLPVSQPADTWPIKKNFQQSV